MVFNGLIAVGCGADDRQVQKKTGVTRKQVSSYSPLKSVLHRQTPTPPPPFSRKNKVTPPCPSLIFNSSCISSHIQPLQVDELMSHKLFESLQVLSIQLHIIVSGSFNPERLHWALAAFVKS